MEQEPRTHLESPDFKGLHDILFVNSDIMTIGLLGHIQDREGHPIWLCCENGERINYNTVISTRKVD